MRANIPYFSDDRNDSESRPSNPRTFCPNRWNTEPCHSDYYVADLYQAHRDDRELFAESQAAKRERWPLTLHEYAIK